MNKLLQDRLADWAIPFLFIQGYGMQFSNFIFVPEIPRVNAKNPHRTLIF